MRWLVTLSATAQDAERLAASFPETSVDDRSTSKYHRQLRLEFEDLAGDADDDDLGIARASIDAHVRRMNDFGRLRWGRTFEGVEVRDYKTVNSSGDESTVLFVERAPDYATPEDLVAYFDERGIPRDKLPIGLLALVQLDAVAVAQIAVDDHRVALVLRLAAEMLAGSEEIDWGAAYSALEAIEQDLRDRGSSGEQLGWWTRKERDNFRATANSVEVLGEHARHGKPFGLTEARMTSAEASWLVRRAVASWLDWRLERQDGSHESAP
jgi:hypothetical protein